MSENRDDKHDSFSRKTAEELIAQSFMPHIFAASRTVGSLYNRKEIPVGLTDQESRALSKYTYFGWTPAVLSGFGVFVTLFGGFRYAKHLAQLRPSFKISQAEHHIQMAQKRAQYAHLDQPSTTTVSPKHSGVLTSQETVKETSDTMMQIQFLFCSAISLWVATVVGNKYSDSHQVFNENLAALPLQTGTSILCERYLCPKVLAHHKNLELQPMSYEMLHLSIEEDRRNKVRRLKSADVVEDGAREERNNENPDRVLWRKFDEDPLAPTPNEVYKMAKQNAAITAELESLQRLVYHCECRHAFEQRCRQHGQALDPRTDLVNVPVNSGVPLWFLTPKDGKSESE